MHALFLCATTRATTRKDGFTNSPWRLLFIGTWMLGVLLRNKMVMSDDVLRKEMIALIVYCFYIPPDTPDWAVIFLTLLPCDMFWSPDVKLVLKMWAAETILRTIKRRGLSLIKAGQKISACILWRVADTTVGWVFVSRALFDTGETTHRRQSKKILAVVYTSSNTSSSLSGRLHRYVLSF